MTQVGVPLSNGRCQAGCITIAFSELHAIDDMFVRMPTEFLVLLQRGPDRWWDIAWQDPATGLIDGSWRYALDLQDAEPIAWCLLPPIGIKGERSA